MEKLLEDIDCPNNVKIRLVSFYLTGPAELWWHGIKDTMVDSFYDDVLQNLSRQFYPPSLRRHKENEFFFARDL